MTVTELTPAQMTERTGASIDTLRYYEKEGLLRDISRAPNGHRRYNEDNVLWVQVLRCLRDTGMSIEQLRHYCDLASEGPNTETERSTMLRDHRALVQQQIDECNVALRLIDHKLEFYANESNTTTESGQS